MVHYSTLQEEKEGTPATKGAPGPARLEEMRVLLMIKGQGRVLPALSFAMYRVQCILLIWTFPDSLEEYLFPLS